MNWVELPAVKWALPIPLLVGVAPFVWWFFRGGASWTPGLAIRRSRGARRIDTPMAALTCGVHPDLPGLLPA
jgi:hypothetical protein